MFALLQSTNEDKLQQLPNTELPVYKHLNLLFSLLLLFRGTREGRPPVKKNKIESTAP